MRYQAAMALSVAHSQAALVGGIYFRDMVYTAGLSGDGGPPKDGTLMTPEADDDDDLAFLFWWFSSLHKHSHQGIVHGRLSPKSLILDAVAPSRKSACDVDVFPNLRATLHHWEFFKSMDTHVYDFSIFFKCFICTTDGWIAWVHHQYPVLELSPCQGLLWEGKHVYYSTFGYVRNVLRGTWRGVNADESRMNNEWSHMVLHMVTVS